MKLLVLHFDGFNFSVVVLVFSFPLGLFVVDSLAELFGLGFPFWQGKLLFKVPWFVLVFLPLE